MAKSKSDISLNDLKAMLPQEGSIAEQEAALRALTTLSQEDRNLLAAVQESPYRLTTLEQFREFPAIPSISSWSPVSINWIRWDGAICLSIQI